jgi:adenosylcobinamide-GDP ribazoletransferase
VLGLVLAVAMRVSAMMLLGDPGRAPALVLAPAFGRLTMVLAAWRAPAAKPDGLGAAFAAAVEPRDVAVASGSALVAGLALGGEAAIAALVVAALVAAAGRALASRLFGGVTGDVLGAAGEVSETCVLALFAIARTGP